MTNPYIHIRIEGEDKPIDFTGLSIKQSVCDHHEASFNWLSEEYKSDNDLQDFVAKKIGKNVTIEFVDEEGNSLPASSSYPNKFSFLINQVHITESDDKQILEISCISPTLLLDDGLHSGSYYQTKLKTVVDSLANGSIQGFTNNISEKSNIDIHYLAQYNETDFDFLQRLATRFGKWFYYDGVSLYFGAHLNSNETIDVRYLSYTASLLPQKNSYQITDWHEGKTTKADMPEPQYSGDGYLKTALEKSAEIFSRKDPDRPLHLPQAINQSQLDLVKDLDAKAKVAKTLDVSGSSYFHGLRPGYAFKINMGKGVSREYIATRVTHICNKKGHYENRFEAVDATVEVPPYTNPRIIRRCEMQPAVVSDNKDTDNKLGRVKVKFAWSDVSPWIRIAAPHSGKDKGWHFIPEIGEDVMVDFEGGDVDKPFILGSLYAGNSQSGLGDADNDIKSLKTRSGNTVVLNDKEGSITIMDAKGSVLIIKGDDTIELKSKKSILIQSEEINIKADKNITIEAGGEMTLKSAKAMSLGTQDEMKQEAMKAFKISTNDQLQASSMQDAKISSTTNLSLEGTVKAEMKGGMASLEGSAQTTVKGGFVMIN